MKKIIILFVFFVTTAAVQAQLTVSSNGNVFVQRDSMTSNAALSVGMMPGVTLQSYDTCKMGIRTYSYNSASSGKDIGVFGEASNAYPTNDNYSILIRCIQELRDEIYELRSKEAKRDIDVEKMIVAK